MPAANEASVLPDHHGGRGGGGGGQGSAEGDCDEAAMAGGDKGSSGVTLDHRPMHRPQPTQAQQQNSPSPTLSPPASSSNSNRGEAAAAAPDQPCSSADLTSSSPSSSPRVSAPPSGTAAHLRLQLQSGRIDSPLRHALSTVPEKGPPTPPSLPSTPPSASALASCSATPLLKASLNSPPVAHSCPTSPSSSSSSSLVGSNGSVDLSLQGRKRRLLEKNATYVHNSGVEDAKKSCPPSSSSANSQKRPAAELYSNLLLQLQQQSNFAKVIQPSSHPSSAGTSSPPPPSSSSSSASVAVSVRFANSDQQGRKKKSGYAGGGIVGASSLTGGCGGNGGKAGSAASGQQPCFQCPVCKKRFQRHIAMNAHFQNEHIGQSANGVEKVCRLCSHRTKTVAEVRAHLCREHNIDLDSPAACMVVEGGGDDHPAAATTVQQQQPAVTISPVVLHPQHQSASLGVASKPPPTGVILNGSCTISAAPSPSCSPALFSSTRDVAVLDSIKKEPAAADFARQQDSAKDLSIRSESHHQSTSVTIRQSSRSPLPEQHRKKSPASVSAAKSRSPPASDSAESGCPLLRCQHCSIVFPNQTLYFLHRGFHSEGNPWKCNGCRVVCADMYDFNTHLVSQPHV